MAKRLAGKNQLKIDILKSYHKVFDSEEGREVLFDMMKTNGMFSSTFNENPYTMAYLEGRRSFISDLVALLGKDVSQIYKIMKEQEEIQNNY